MKVVARYPKATGAHSARAALESAGIRAVVLDHTARNLPVGSFISGDVKVAVADQDAQRAARILNTMAPGRGYRCPRCDSKDNMRLPVPVFWVLLVYAFTLGLVKPKRICKECLHEWRGRNPLFPSAES